MGNLKLAYSIFLFFISSFSSSSSINKCPDEQRDALLVFKQNISSDKRSYGYYNINDQHCRPLHGSRYDGVVKMNWKTSIDCCDWDGITCNNFTGNVVGVNLTCGMLKGVVKLDALLSSLPKLEAIDLSYSGLSVVTRNDAHYANPEFYELSLASCNLRIFPNFLRAMGSLRVLDLSRNHISGHIPAWAGEIGGNNLTYLDLSGNSITSVSKFRSGGLNYLNLQSNLLEGPFPQWICDNKHLKFLDISNNGITGMIPECLQNINSSLVSFNVSYNMIQGQFPKTICIMGKLLYLDLSNNNFHGMIPECLQNINSSLVSFNVRSNMIQGQFPTTICNMGKLLYLDLSNNSFHGVIPQCFGNITSSLAVIDLGDNTFHGTIPKVYGYCGIEGLLLNGNKLEGEVPSSLAKCKSLKLLDLGNNMLNGTFPRWLEDLPKLQILILSSNNLHGTVEVSSIPIFPFSSLKIFDISNNGFVGRLPGKYFETFNAIKDVDKDPKTEFVNISGLPSYSINVPVPFNYGPTIIIFFTAVDLSSNKFEGEIPNVIANLKSLTLLNLSHNNLSGQIPNVLGNIYDMEALDLSWNQLVGEIPQSLVNLNFMGFLNLSQNHLVGRIPVGRQFNTFEEESYLGNPGLCGMPLDRDCEDLSSPQVGAEGGEYWIYIEPVMLGLGCGTLLGVVLGYRMLSTGRPKWFNAIADAGGHTRRKKRKHHTHIRKRN